MECLQFILFGFNVVFWMIGATMLGVGIWVAVDPGAFDALDIANSAGMEDDVWAAAIYTFIAVGALLFLVGFFGCLGAARADRSSFFLWLYAGFVGVIIVAEIVIVILTAVYWYSITEEVAISMYNDVHSKYVSEESEDGTSKAWNSMQKDWQCCGSYNYTDYKLSKYDNQTVAYNNSKIDIWIPYTCCKNPEITIDKLNCQTGQPEYIYEKGCYHALVDFLNKNAPIIIGITCGFAALQITGLLIACFLIQGMERKSKESH